MLAVTDDIELSSILTFCKIIRGISVNFFNDSADARFLYNTCAFVELWACKLICDEQQTGGETDMNGWAAIHNGTEPPNRRTYSTVGQC